MATIGEQENNLRVSEVKCSSSLEGFSMDTTKQFWIISSFFQLENCFNNYKHKIVVDAAIFVVIKWKNIYHKRNRRNV